MICGPSFRNGPLGGALRSIDRRPIVAQSLFDRAFEAGRASASSYQDWPPAQM